MNETHAQGDTRSGTHILMIKPDAVQRNLIGEIISRIEKKGLKLVGGKFMQVPMELAENIIVNMKENRSTTS